MIRRAIEVLGVIEEVKKTARALMEKPAPSPRAEEKQSMKKGAEADLDKKEEVPGVVRSEDVFPNWPLGSKPQRLRKRDRIKMEEVQKRHEAVETAEAAIAVVEQPPPVVKMRPAAPARTFETRAPMAGPECDHGLVFDAEACRDLLASGKIINFILGNDQVPEVRRRWPRLQGKCPKNCGYDGIAYVSTEHYVAGDW